MTPPTIFLLFLVFVAAGTCLQSHFLATIWGIRIRNTKLWEDFIKYELEMGSGSEIQKLIGKDTHTDIDTERDTHSSKVISYACFHFSKLESKLEIVKFVINVSEKVVASLFRVGSVKSHVVKISFNIDFINDKEHIMSIIIRQFG
jgi:hypothetical protein